METTCANPVTFCKKRADFKFSLNYMFMYIHVFSITSSSVKILQPSQHGHYNFHSHHCFSGSR